MNSTASDDLRAQIKRMCGAALLCAAALPLATLAQDVGRDLNFQTPSSPNYRPLPTPTDDYKLPPLSTTPAQDAPISSGLRFTPKKIVVEGATVLSPAEIAAIVGPYENRLVSSADLQSIRLALSRRYVEKGYVSSGVVLPDQRVENGVVVFRAVEGKLSSVELVGDSRLRQGYVAKRIAREVEDPLNVSDLQYALRVLQQDPNVARLDARLAPGAEMGSSILRLAIDDQPRFQVGVGADNHRASSTGAERITVFASARNLTGYGDELRVSTGLSEGANDGSLVFSMPLTTSNIAVQAYYAKSNADIIEDRFEELDIKSESTTWGLSLNVPFVDALEDKLSVSLGFESTSSDTELLGVPFSFSPGAQDGHAETAAALLGLDWLKRGASYAAGARLTYRRGLDMLDATINDYEPNSIEALFNPTGADGEFGLFQAQATFIKRLSSMWLFGALNDRAQLVLRTTAQISQDPLLSLEKVSIGGINSVRGYPENLLVRDNGIAATMELHLPLPGYRADAHPLNVVVVPFVDYGRSWDKVDTDPGSELRNSDDARYIMSAGLGLLWKPLRGLDVQAFWGADIADNFEGDDPRQFREADLQDDGLHFSVTYVARF